MDALREDLPPPRFSAQQAELIEQALRGPGIDDATRRAEFYRLLAAHRALEQMEQQAGPPEWSGPPDSDAEGDRMVAETHSRLRAFDLNDQQMELLEQALLDHERDAAARRVEFRRRLVAHLESRADALRTPSEQSD